jgi:serine/threonine protein kinase
MPNTELEQRAKGRIGTVLCGKYRIDSVLGVGGMAVVFAATHRNQKRVAIKMLHPELSLNEQLKTRFLREGYAANTVDHAGAVAVLDDDTAEDGVAFLVMERLEGEEVDRLWEKWGRHLPPDVVLAIAGQLLDVLTAAHAKSIIHRDIKPSNLYVTNDGTVKVLDFGIARVRDAANAGPSATSTGMMLGTPAFMAPEQALGKSKEMDGTTDVWSVGATMFALLSGEFVHTGESVTELVIFVATQPARSLATVAPHVDPRIVDIVDRALAFQKKDRWQSAATMRDMVRAAYLAMYGTKLTKEPLERFLTTEPPSEMASTAYAPSVPPPTPDAVPVVAFGAVRPSQVPVVPTRKMAAWTPPATPPAIPAGQAAPLPSRTPDPTRPMTAFHPHASTAQPVSSESYQPPGVTKSGLSPVLLGVLAAAGITVGGGVVILLANSHASTGPGSAASSIVSATENATAQALPPATPTPLEPASATPVYPAQPPAPSASASATRPVPPVVNPQTPRPPPPPVTTKVDCRVPYTIDKAGIRHGKLECE